MRCLIFLCFLVLSICCTNSAENQRATKTISTQEIQIDSTGIFVHPFQSDEGWGYNIYIDGKRYIHQPYQPAIGGNQPFVSEALARRIGTFVAYKIEQGIMPPSITEIELDSLINSMK